MLSRANRSRTHGGLSGFSGRCVGYACFADGLLSDAGGRLRLGTGCLPLGVLDLCVWGLPEFCVDWDELVDFKSVSCFCGVRIPGPTTWVYFNFLIE